MAELEVRTVTVRRSDQDITVEVRETAPGQWVLSQALDEDGNTVTLTRMEWTWALSQVRAGHDETGR